MKTHTECKQAVNGVRLLGAVSGAVLMALAAARATADSPQTVGSEQPQQSSEVSAPMLSEVTVTAQHVVENSQNVPIPITTVTPAQMQVSGAVSFKTLSDAVPSITTPGTFWANSYIRGVGTDSASPNVEPAVATYIDDVYEPSSYGLAGMAFTDISQISVLKGPQGTLFGRNTTGGVIQITTEDPQEQFGGHASLGFGNYDTVEAKSYVTGGLTNDLAADLGVVYNIQGEGWGYDPPFDRRIDWQHDVAARSKWVYRPSDTTKVTTAFDYTNFTSDGANNQLLPGSFAPVEKTVTFPGNYNCLCIPNVGDVQQYSGALTIDQQFGALEGVSISSYRNVSGQWSSDSDNVPQLYDISVNKNDADYVTQEFRLRNAHPGRIRWQVGAFFFGANSHLDPQATEGTKVAQDGYEAAFGNQTTRSSSLFGQATGEITADTHLTVGLRYTDETLKGYSWSSNALGAIYSGPFYGKIISKPWTYRAALDHQFTSNLLGYVSYDHGFKGGGFNLSAPSAAPFFPEQLDAYQAGLKSEFLQHRVRLNVETFYYDFKNLQVTVVPGGGAQIDTNAASARNYGLDGDLDFAATDHLTFSASASYLKAYYVSYPDAEGFTALGKPILLANAAGKELPYSPRFSGSLGGNYAMPTRIGEFKSSVSVSYQDAYVVSPTEEPVAPEYFLLNASVEWWSNADEPFGVRLWGRNLTNSYYIANLISSSNGWYGTYSAPRTYGVTLMKNF
jgi:iron complex outermembrane recepter protein